MNKPIKLPPEFRSGNSIPVERATITRERMIEILAEAADPYIETLFKIGEHLGIDYQAARKAPGKPSDVYIDAIEADRQSQDREDDPLQPAVNWLNEAIVDLTATDIQRRLFVGHNRAQRMLDHARRAGEVK